MERGQVYKKADIAQESELYSQGEQDIEILLLNFSWKKPIGV